MQNAGRLEKISLGRYGRGSAAVIPAARRWRGAPIMATSAEQIICDIEDMKVKGAYLITRVSLEALALRAKEAAAERIPIPEALRTASSRLQAAQPSMASVANACAYVLHP